MVFNSFQIEVNRPEVNNKEKELWSKKKQKLPICVCLEAISANIMKDQFDLGLQKTEAFRKQAYDR